MSRLVSSLSTLLILALLVAGCGDTSSQEQKDQVEAAPIAEAAPQDSRVFHVLAFDGVQHFKYMMHLHGPGAGATLFTLDETLHLDPEPTASGAKYQGERIMVWIKGQEVLFEVDGKRVGPCKISGLQDILARAWLAGTLFWASGNEPSWNLIMGQDRVVLLTENGTVRREFPGLEDADLDPRAPAGVHHFRDGKGELEVEILDGRCSDTMSGAPFAASVILRLDGVEMRGCGTGLF